MFYVSAAILSNRWRTKTLKCPHYHLHQKQPQILVQLGQGQYFWAAENFADCSKLQTYNHCTVPRRPEMCAKIKVQKAFVLPHIAAANLREAIKERCGTGNWGEATKKKNLTKLTVLVSSWHFFIRRGLDLSLPCHNTQAYDNSLLTVLNNDEV